MTAWRRSPSARRSAPPIPLPGPPAAYLANYGSPDQTQIVKLVSVPATADVAAGENLIPIQSAVPAS